MTQRLVSWGSPLLAGVLAVVLVGLPLFSTRIVYGHDALTYVARTVQFQRALADTPVPVWAPDLSMGLGQPFFYFNPPLVYALATLWDALVGHVMLAINLSTITVIFLAGAGCFAFTRALFGWKPALAATIAYVLGPYFLVNLYVRHALSDFSAFAILPFAFWGLWGAVTRAQRRYVLMGAAAVGALLLATNPVVVIALPALLAWVIYLAAGQPDRAAWLRGVGTLAGGIGASAWFWLPAILDRGHVHLQRLLEGWLPYHQHFVEPWQLIWYPWGFESSTAGPGDGHSLMIGLVTLVTALCLALAMPLLLRRDRPLAAQAGFWLAILAAAAFMTTYWARPIWDAMPLLQYMAFPWRYLTLATFAGALVIGAAVRSLYHLPVRARAPVTLAGLGLILVLQWPLAQPRWYWPATPADYTPEAIVERNIRVTTAREYEPIWMRQAPATPPAAPADLAPRGGTIEVRERTTTSLVLDVATDRPAILTPNIAYFPGWTAWIDGAQVPITVSQTRGVLLLPLDAGTSTVTLRYLPTNTRIAGALISIATFSAGTALLLISMVQTVRWPVPLLNPSPMLHRPVRMRPDGDGADPPAPVR